MLTEIISCRHVQRFIVELKFNMSILIIDLLNDEVHSTPNNYLSERLSQYFFFNFIIEII